MINTVDQLERGASATWSPDETAVIDGWRVSSNGGFTHRLNSATAIGLAETSLETKRSVTRWLSERGSPLVVRVTPLMDPVNSESCQRNWYLEPKDETVAMTRPINGSAEIPDATVVDPLDPAFVEEFFSLNGRRPADDGTWVRMVNRTAPDAIGLWIGGAAVAYVATSGALAFVYSVAVEASERRRGLGTQLMAAAETWAGARGARSLVVQVLGTNAPARGLYQCLGFTEAYRYHYLQAAPHESGGT